MLVTHSLEPIKKRLIYIKRELVAPVINVDKSKAAQILYAKLFKDLNVEPTGFVNL